MNSNTHTPATNNQNGRFGGSLIRLSLLNDIKVQVLHKHGELVTSSKCQVIQHGLDESRIVLEKLGCCTVVIAN